MTDLTNAACSGWDNRDCEGSPHCPPRCPRFIDKRGARWTLRPATADDRGPLEAMYADFDPGDRVQGLPPGEDDGIERWLAELLETGWNVVAAGEDRRVGHAVYEQADDPRPELAVFVHPEFRGRGLGSELCRHAIASAAVAADRDALELQVARSNREMIHIARALGFRLVDSSGPTLEMWLPLGEPVTYHVRQPPSE